MVRRVSISVGVVVVLMVSVGVDGVLYASKSTESVVAFMVTYLLSLRQMSVKSEF